MKKGIITLGIALFVLSAGTVSAEMNFSTKSPMYNTTFGTGIGGFSATHNVGTGLESAQAVQATAEEWEGKAKESNVTIKTPETKDNYVNTSANLGGGEDYAYEKGSDGYVYGYAEGGEQGVNQTKTMYKDGIGRIHFFGKETRTRD